MKKIFGTIIAIIGMTTTTLSFILHKKGQFVVGRVKGSTSTFVAGKVRSVSAIKGIFVGTVPFIVGIVLIARKK